MSSSSDVDAQDAAPALLPPGSPEEAPALLRFMSTLALPPSGHLRKHPPAIKKKLFGEALIMGRCSNEEEPWCTKEEAQL